MSSVFVAPNAAAAGPMVGQQLPVVHAHIRDSSRVATRGLLGVGAKAAQAAPSWLMQAPSRVEVGAVVGAVAALAAVARKSKKQKAPQRQVVKIDQITEAQVIAAQKAWSDGIVAISAEKANGGDYAQMASDHIKKMYGYEQGPVLFKPTLAADAPFRPTFEGAFSYFVATNGLYPEDKGFAIKGWTAVRWENSKITINGDTALAMGNYYFSLPDGSITKVEYTFGYFLDKDGNVRINLHHSSVPFSAGAPPVTEELVVAAQKAWSDGIVAISAAKANGGDYAQMASDHIKNMYGYEQGPVLFKPTLAADAPFRPTFEGAFSYFVATNGLYPEDKGFAIKGWTAVRWENSKITINGDTALAMGNYYFSLPDGSITKVEYTFGYFLDAEGNLRINLHHSSVPFSAGGPKEVTQEMVLSAQKAWSDGIVAISAAKANGGNYAQMASDHIKNMYGYEQGPVLFKPTLAADVPFRPTFEGAFSYFVATSGFAEEDTGFAIKGWTAVRWENDKIICNGDTALAMGNYFFSLPDGSVTKVEYTFGFFLDAEGNLRINLHHSSVPFKVPTPA